MSDTAETVLAREHRNILLDKLNDAQYEAATHYEGPYVVVAGPGAGKTATTVARAAYMIQAGVDPNSILMFTFTRKAANEIRERIGKAMGPKAAGLTVSTYHSFCCKLLRRYADLIGWTDKFSIYDEEDKMEVIKKIVQEGGIKVRPEMIARDISELKEKMVSPAQALEEAGTKYENSVATVYDIYEAAKKSMNVFDFDDMIYFVIRIFENFPEVVEEVNDKYRYITADESHDSSPRDLRLIEYLGGDKFNVCMVLDDWQSKDMLLMQVTA